MKKTEPEYYPPVENLLDLIYEHYTENDPVEKNTVAGKAAKAKEKVMDRQGTVCCAWEKTAFEEGLKVGIRLMMEVYSL